MSKAQTTGEMLVDMLEVIRAVRNVAGQYNAEVLEGQHGTHEMTEILRLTEDYADV